jgi:translation initiation factor IF-2
MSKIRINELARELEVKPNVILDLLPELGVADKKTHSSSLDDDVALQIRQRVVGEAGSDSAVSITEEAAPARAAEPSRPQPAPKPETAGRTELKIDVAPPPGEAQKELTKISCSRRGRRIP